jgi:hypothetical protein
MDNLTRIIGGGFLILVGVAALVAAIGYAAKSPAPNGPYYVPAPYQAPYQPAYPLMPYGPNYQPTPNCYPNCPNPDHNRRPGELDNGSLGSGKLGSKGAKE